MKALICSSCGASRWKEDDDYRICLHCGTKYEKPTERQKRYINAALQVAATSQAKSVISLNDDVARLLRKCEEEPLNARKYANLILDIDPTNEEALRYIH